MNLLMCFDIICAVLFVSSFLLIYAHFQINLPFLEYSVLTCLDYVFMCISEFFSEILCIDLLVLKNFLLSFTSSLCSLHQTLFLIQRNGSTQITRNLTLEVGILMDSLAQCSTECW